jgi:putative pyoverdin transport system ATP-binding/permease protein
MPLLTLFMSDLTRHAKSFILLACLSGIANTIVLATINDAAGKSDDHDALLRIMIMFIIAILLFVITQKRLMVLASQRVEAIIDSRRQSLFSAIRDTDLRSLENIDHAQMFACVSRETQTISQATPMLVVAAQDSVLMVTTLAYMAYLSPLAFSLWIGGTIFGAAIHLSRFSAIKQKLVQVYNNENAMIGRLTDLLNGFKEVKMNSRRATELSQHFFTLSAKVSEQRFEMQNLSGTDHVLSLVTFYLLTGLMVFVVPVFSDSFSDTVIMTTTASLFLMGPVATMVAIIPVVANLNSAATAILSLEHRLEQVAEHANAQPMPFQVLNSIRLEQVLFQHRDATNEGGFTIGPISLEITAGQVIFITGGNGSGKTTLIRLLTGLYPIQSGMLWCNRTLIDRTNIVAYRNLFSTVFSDNHLFDELYGIEQVDMELAHELITLLEIGHKSQIMERHFTNTHLSGGQRKRLALIAALLEKKQICIFDEWAADQDPAFRAKFYHVIIPMLKAQGIAVLAITHDERYFEVADTHLHMEEGLLTVVRTNLPILN